MASPALIQEWKNAQMEQEQIPEVPSSALLLESQGDAFRRELAHAERLLGSRDEHDEPYYSRETLDRGAEFLRMHAEWIWKSCGSKAPVPTIGPGPQGSLDLYWKMSSFELLVNIPASDGELGTFFARDNNKQTAKGSFDPKRFALSIASWLMM